MNLRKRKIWWKKKKFVIPVFLVVFMIGIRLVLEPILLKVANDKGQTINPIFASHIENLDLTILRGRVLLQDVTGKLKKHDKEFVEVNEIGIDLALRELFRGNIKFDVELDQFKLQMTRNLLAAVKNLPKEKKKKELPFELSKLDIKNSVIVFPEYPGLNNQKQLLVNNIHGRVTGITGEKGTPLSHYEFQAGLSRKDDIKVTGNFDISTETPRWDLNGNVKKFNLAAGNKTLKNLVPMNFKKGTLDVYTEMKSEKGKIFGYVKPFLNDVEFMGNKNEFKGAKHFFVELASAVTNFVFENSDKKSVATRVPFFL